VRILSCDATAPSRRNRLKVLAVATAPRDNRVRLSE
jgi:hypothetical protein